MADKITNFSDYKKRESEKVEKKKELNIEETGKDISETTEINNIEIVDPYNFFNEEEREEYFRERQKADESVKEKSNEKVIEDEPAPHTERPERPEKPEQPKALESESVDRTEEDYEDEDYDEEEYDEDYEEDYEDEEDDNESSSFITPELLVRIASVITGIFILVMIAFVVKEKIYDKYFNDPDEQQVEVVALPEGYTETNDTVTVTTDLNLRSVPSTESKEYIQEVAPKGTVLNRIAVSSDGSWALVEYNGQRLYGSMKYLSTP